MNPGPGLAVSLGSRDNVWWESSRAINMILQEDAPVEIEPVHSAFYLMLRELKCERRIEVMGIEIIGHRLIYSALPLPRASPPQ